MPVAFYNLQLYNTECKLKVSFNATNIIEKVQHIF